MTFTYFWRQREKKASVSIKQEKNNLHTPYESCTI